MATNYRRRIVDDYFASRLRATGALVIEGPKWCGKTRTAENLSKSALYLQDEDKRKMYMIMAETKPSSLLEGDTPRLIDEWQVAPRLWNAARFEIDKRQKRGQFIFTGSSAPNIDKETEATMHSGTGRIAVVRMRPMSLFESGDSDGSVSISELFRGNLPDVSESDMDLDKLAYLICRGGWPGNLDLDREDSLRIPKDYLDAVIRSDASVVDGVKRNPDDVETLIKSLSRNISTMANVKTIVRDMGGVLERKTVGGHINALKKIFIIEDTPAWSPALLSKAQLRRSPKRNFVDPSIAAAALNIGPEKLVEDHSSFGPLFESVCIRDLRSYSQPLDGKVSHYHDNSDLEVDAIISLKNGKWGAIEIKLNPLEMDKASKNLLMLKRKTKLVDGEGPSFLMVITGTGFVHLRDDGVMVVPIGCLRD